MLGELLLKIRKDRHITKTELSRDTQINIGHISHIEKGERTPSHKALKKICNTLDVPYQQLMYTYDKELTEDHRNYEITNHIAYNSILAVNSLDDLIFCPSSFGTASLAIKIQDNSMEPTLLKGSYAFIEFNSPLNTKDIGLFYYNNTFIIRRFMIRKNGLILKSDNKDLPDITLSEKDNFYIIGKILGTNDDY